MIRVTYRKDQSPHVLTELDRPCSHRAVVGFEGIRRRLTREDHNYFILRRAVHSPLGDPDSIVSTGQVPGTAPLGDSLGGPGNVVPRKESYHLVDFRTLFEQFPAVALGQAAGHDDASQPAATLHLGHLSDHFERFGPGRVEEAARVDDHQIGSLGLDRPAVAGPLQPPEHLLAVDEVFWATQANEGTCATGGLFAAFRHGDFCTV